MILPIAILLAIIGLILVPAVQRLRDVRSLPALTWLVVVAATILPLAVAWVMLQPGTPVQSAAVQAEKETVKLVIPPGHDLLVTAALGEETGAPDSGKTAYALHVQGDGWGQNLAETIRRKTSDGQGIDVRTGTSVSESGKQRAGSVGENLQDRFRLNGEGAVEITVKNYQGTAAKALNLTVVKAPPPIALLWPIAIGIAAITLYLEVKRGIEKIAGDISSLAFYGALMPQAGITPLDSIKGVAFAGLGAVLLGQGLVAGIAWVANKYVTSKEEAEKAPPPPTKGKRRR